MGIQSESSVENTDEFYFDVLFDESRIESNRAEDKVYDESEAIEFLRNLPSPEEPFWKQPPILNSTQITQLYNLASALVRFCEEERIEIWVDGGTLLGAIRHKRLIPWDDDMDFAIMKQDWKRFLKRVSPKLTNSGYGVSEWWFGGCRVYPMDGSELEHPTGSLSCRYPFADIFWVRPDKAEREKLVYYDYRARCLWPGGMTIGDLRPLRKYQLGPLQLPGPNVPENHLNALYGHDWKTVVYQTSGHNRSGQFVKIRVKLDEFTSVENVNVCLV